MRPFLIGLVSFGLTAASGCGTIFNTFGPHENPHAYGGVEIDCKAIQGTWSKSNEPTELPVAEKVLLTGLIAVDFPLCIIGDSITLPGVILQSGFRNSGWDFGKEKLETENPVAKKTTSD